MRFLSKQFILFFSIFIMSGTCLSATAPDEELEKLFNWTENNFPQHFPEHQPTKVFEPWTYRFYLQTGVYLGEKDNNIFVLGGPWGTNTPTFISNRQDLIAQMGDSSDAGGIPACNTTDTTAGLVFTQNENIVNITTNDQCIVTPNQQRNSFCKFSKPSVATGISIKSTPRITSSALHGIQNIQLKKQPAITFHEAAHCTINAPVETVNLIVSSDICIDITEEMSAYLEGSATLNSPVTFAYVGTHTNQVVTDCFDTDAATISDALTGETWVIDELSITDKGPLIVNKNPPIEDEEPPIEDKEPLKTDETPPKVDEEPLTTENQTPPEEEPCSARKTVRSARCQ